MGKQKLKGGEITVRAKELKPIRDRAYKHLDANPLLTSMELKYILITEGISDIPYNTVCGWFSRYQRKQKRVVERPLIEKVEQITTALQDKTIKSEIIELLCKGYNRKQLIKEGFAERTVDQAISAYKKLRVKQLLPQFPQFDAIIKAVPDIQTLGILVLEGFNAALTNRDLIISDLRKELKEVTEERNKIMAEFNEKIAKVKIGTLTLDTFQHKLIPKY